MRRLSRGGPWCTRLGLAMAVWLAGCAGVAPPARGPATPVPTTPGPTTAGTTTPGTSTPGAAAPTGAPGTGAAPGTGQPGMAGVAGVAGVAGAPGTPGTPGTAPAPGTAAATGPASAAGAVLRPRARWVPVDFAALPGWTADRATELWPALRAGCVRPPAAWAALCARALAFNPPDDGFARDFLERELQPWRVESLAGEAVGLATGYFEPVLPASRLPRPGFRVALHRPPADLASRKPYWTRQQLAQEPAARRALEGQEIAHLASPLDLLVLQIQGSGRLLLTEPDGRQRLVRVGFAAHNEQPYRSVGRWLIDQGELPADGASWPAIRAWGEAAAPERLNAMLWSNPRVVFFKEEALPDDALPAVQALLAGRGGAADDPALAAGPGPRGAQGVPLSAGRSAAVDPQAIPYGTVLWLDTTEPLSTRPLQRLVMAQDTGGAIVGAVRVDWYVGSGPQAEQSAGRMKQPLRLYALWPRGEAVR